MRSSQKSIKNYVNRGHSIISDHTFRASASQCLATFATNLLKFTSGSYLGMTIILLEELYKKDAEIKISLSELTWFGSSCFMVPVGSLLTGLLAQKLGPRRFLLISAILFITSLIMFYFATNSTMLLCAQAVGGITFPAALGPGTTYIVEITQPHLRSALMASSNLFVIIGSFSTILYSNWLYWRTILLINLISPALGFFFIQMIPESPHWLASKGKFEEARDALSWLRGWNNTESTSREFNSLKKTYEMSDKNTTDRLTSSPRTVLKTYFHRSFFLPFATVSCMFILHSCTGYNAIAAYSMIIFKNIDAPIDNHLAASLFDIMRIVGAVVCILSVYYTGKRKLIFFSSIGAGLSYFTIATLLILRKQSSYINYAYVFNWTAAMAVITSTFLTSSGIDKVVFMYNAELFPTKFRNVGSGIGLFIYASCSAIVNKSYLYLEEAVTLSGTFIIFGIFCFICCIVFYFILPETEGKTLQEIDDHYTKTNNSKHDNS